MNSPLFSGAVPAGMSRRHFMHHLAGASALALPAISLTDALAANSPELKKKHKAAIMLWMGGGPATIDIWDLKPGAPTGGPFRPISTNGDLMNKAIGSDKGSFLEEVAANSKLNNAAKINYLFLAAMARRPTAKETEAANQLMALRGGNATAALQDVWWAVLNSNEFILNH